MSRCPRQRSARARAGGASAVNGVSVDGMSVALCWTRRAALRDAAPPVRAARCTRRSSSTVPALTACTSRRASKRAAERRCSRGAALSAAAGGGARATLQRTLRTTCYTSGRAPNARAAARCSCGRSTRCARTRTIHSAQGMRDAHGHTYTWHGHGHGMHCAGVEAARGRVDGGARPVPRARADVPPRQRAPEWVDVARHPLGAAASRTCSRAGVPDSRLRARSAARPLSAVGLSPRGRGRVRLGRQLHRPRLHAGGWAGVTRGSSP